MKILMLLENEFRNDPRVEKEVATFHKAGHEIIVGAINQSDLPLIEQRSNCIVLRKNISIFRNKTSVGALKFPFYFNFWRHYLNEIFIKYTFDVIHVHDLPLCSVATEFKRKYKTKIVIDLHENYPSLLSISSHINTMLGKILSSEKQWRLFERNCAGNADVIITVVQEMKERISDLSINTEKIFVVQNTPVYRSDDVIRFDRENEYLTLVYIGGISYHRGLQYAIAGLSLLVKEIPVRLWIAGDGKYSALLKEQVSRLSLERSVKFFGKITKSETESLMKKADIGLIPHIKSEQSDNSSPNKLFEYMAVGLPVLASNCTSVKRIIDETDSGMTYTFDSAENFASVIKEIYNNRNRTFLFSNNGINAVKNKYNWENDSAILLKAYKYLSIQSLRKK